QKLRVEHRRMPGTAGVKGPGVSVVAPLSAGNRVLGVVALESQHMRDCPPQLRRQIAAVAETGPLQLAAALLFDEVREVAPPEERRRLCREIHDGVAQELASLGYAVDALLMTARESGDQGYAEGVQALREHITKLLAALRISIYDMQIGREHV